MTDTYSTALEAAVRAWIHLNRADYELIRDGVLASFHRAGQPLPEKGTLTRQSIDAAIVEAIRKRIDFPTERRHEAGERLPSEAHR